MLEDKLTQRIIGLAIDVHTALGPGVLESVYEAALCMEFETAGVQFQRQLVLPVVYKTRQIGQLLTYLRITGKRIGLLINFNSHFLKTGIRRLILDPAPRL